MNVLKRLCLPISLCFGIALLSFELPASQAEELPERGTIALATGSGYAPFVGNKLHKGGWSVDVVRQAFNRLSLDIILEVLPWDRALKWTNEHEVLAAFPFVFTAKRAESFLFSKPINHVPIHMYVAAQSEYSNIEQLRGKRLCFPLSYSLGEVEKATLEKYEMTINRAKDGYGCIQHVNKGWSDAGLTNGYINANRLNKTPNQSAIKIFETQLGVLPLYLVISKNHPQSQKWIDEFNHGLALLESSGEKSDIDQQHLQLIHN